jgi:hypothetical protein
MCDDYGGDSSALTAGGRDKDGLEVFALQIVKLKPVWELQKTALWVSKRLASTNGFPEGHGKVLAPNFQLDSLKVPDF